MEFPRAPWIPKKITPTDQPTNQPTNEPTNQTECLAPSWPLQPSQLPGAPSAGLSWSSAGRWLSFRCFPMESHSACCLGIFFGENQALTKNIWKTEALALAALIPFQKDSSTGMFLWEVSETINQKYYISLQSTVIYIVFHQLSPYLPLSHASGPISGHCWWPQALIQPHSHPWFILDRLADRLERGLLLQSSRNDAKQSLLPMNEPTHSYVMSKEVERFRGYSQSYRLVPCWIWHEMERVGGSCLEIADHFGAQN